jgi:hypothetical protein
MGRSMTEDVTAYLSTMRYDVPNPVRNPGPADVESAPESSQTSSIPVATDSPREVYIKSDVVVGNFAGQIPPDDTLVEECPMYLEPKALALANDISSTR